jgi:hypothetical protein
MPRPDEIIRIADSEFDAVGLGESLVQVGVMARDGIAPPPGAAIVHDGATETEVAAATERNRGMTS